MLNSASLIPCSLGLICACYDNFAHAIYCSVTIPLVYQLGVKVSLAVSSYWETYHSMEKQTQGSYHHKMGILTVIWLGTTISLFPSSRYALFAIPLLVKQAVKPLFLRYLTYNLSSISLEILTDYSSFKCSYRLCQIGLLGSAFYLGNRLIRYLEIRNGQSVLH